MNLSNIKQTLIILSVFFQSINVFSQVSFTSSQTGGCLPLTVECVPTLPPGTFSHQWQSSADLVEETVGSNISYFTFQNISDASYIKLIAYDSTGKVIDTYYQKINLISQENYFFKNKSVVCPNETIILYNFQNNSTTTWISENDTINASEAHFTYSQPGYHKVYCIKNGPCYVDTLIDSVEVRIDVIPNSGFELGSQNVCPGSNVDMNAYVDGYLNYSWDFGDSYSSNTTNPNINHTFNSAGNFSVTLTVSNTCGNSSQSTLNLIANNNAPFDPLITFFTYDQGFCPNQSIELTVQNAEGVNYLYQFNDGTLDVLTNQIQTKHVYSDTGTFIPSVTIYNACGGDTTIYYTVHVQQNSPVLNGYLSPSINVETSCVGEPITFSTKNVSGNYEWIIDGNLMATNSPEIIHQFSDTGAHTVLVKITNLCGFDTTIIEHYQIVGGKKLSSLPFVTVSPATTCPNSNVNFRLAPYNSYGISSIIWDFGDGIQTTAGYGNMVHYYDTAGTYQVNVRFLNFCGDDSIVTKTVIISENTYLPSTAYISGIQKSCISDLTEFSLLRNNGSSMQYYFSSVIWDFGDNTAKDSTSSLYTNHRFTAPGIYTVSAKLYNRCGHDTTLYFTHEVSQSNTSPFINDYLDIQKYPQIDNFCVGDKINFTTNSSYSRYYWDFGDGVWYEGNNSPTYAFDSVGDYLVRVKIESGCGDDTILSTTVFVNNNVFPESFSVSYTSAICAGEQNKFNVNAEFIKYQWDFGNYDTITTYDTYLQKQFDTLGVYLFKVTAYNGCGNSFTVSKSFSVTNENQLRVINLSSNTNKACVNDKIIFSVSGGLSSYTYYWDFGDGDTVTTIGTGVSHQYLQNGNYNVTVVCKNNCGYTRTLTNPVIIQDNAPAELKPNSFGFYSESYSSLAGCSGDVIAFFVSGDFQHVWDFGDGTSDSGTETYLSPSGSIQTITRHAYPAPGTYYAKVTKTNACGNSITDSVEVFISTSASAQGFLTVQAPLTVGGYNTCAPIKFLSGGGVSYTWNFGDGNTLITSSPNTSHLYTSPGVYATTVQVRNNCGSTADYTFSSLVNPGPILDVNFSNIIQPSCLETSNGSVTVNIIGGEAPYSLIWDNNSDLNSATVNDFKQGQHIVQISDANNCLITDTVVLNSTSNLGLSLSFQQASSCSSPTGAALVQNTGGLAPYTYSWSNGTSGQLASNLDVGIYYATVSDANNCSTTIPVNISSALGPVIASQNIVSPLCYGDNNGVIAITVGGGTSPYNYSWSNGSSSNMLSNIVAGEYSVVITDNAGCKTIEKMIVPQPSEITATFLNNNADCSKFNGEASVVVSGGAEPYQYQWSEGSNTYKQPGLPIGDYEVTVTDNNGCYKNFQTSILNNNAPLVNATINNVDCNGNNNGSIALNISGGTSPYLKTWFHNGAHSSSINNLTPGNYTVSVLDASGCQVYQQFNVTEPQPLNVVLETADVNCGMFNGYINANVSGGTAPYNYLWSNNQTSAGINGLGTGNYSVTVTDLRDCITNAAQQINLVINSEPICLVTVDETSAHNEIVWENPSVGLNGIAGFKVYRNAASTYVLVDTVRAGFQTVYTDTTSGINPNATQYRYKISVYDSCGNESDLSLYHQTIWLQEPSFNIGGNFVDLQWANYAIENTSLDTTYYYRIELDTIGNGTWYGVDSVANGILNYNHINPPASDTLIYRVVIVVPDGCEPTRARIATSRSNVKNSSRLTLIKEAKNVNVVVKPNPTRDLVTISGDYNKGGAVNITVFDINGRSILQEVINSKEHLNYNLDLSDYAVGMYHLQISNQNFVVNKKIIKVD